MRLFYISDDPGIKSFVPRLARQEVWAVNDEIMHN